MCLSWPVRPCLGDITTLLVVYWQSVCYESHCAFQVGISILCQEAQGIRSAGWTAVAVTRMEIKFSWYRMVLGVNDMKLTNA